MVYLVTKSKGKVWFRICLDVYWTEFLWSFVRETYYSTTSTSEVDILWSTKQSIARESLLFLFNCLSVLFTDAFTCVVAGHLLLITFYTMQHHYVLDECSRTKTRKGREREGEDCISLPSWSRVTDRGEEEKEDLQEREWMSKEAANRTLKSDMSWRKMKMLYVFGRLVLLVLAVC